MLARQALELGFRIECLGCFIDGCWAYVHPSRGGCGLCYRELADIAPMAIRIAVVETKRFGRRTPRRWPRGWALKNVPSPESNYLCINAYSRRLLGLPKLKAPSAALTDQRLASRDMRKLHRVERSANNRTLKDSVEASIGDLGKTKPRPGMAY